MSKPLQEQWPSGPWNLEADRGGFKHAGHWCRIRRSEELGHLCGYVRVENGHPFFEAPDDVLLDLDVHGGVTYAGNLDTDHWWIGFDCAHCYDFVPLTGELTGKRMGSYRNWSFVEAECKKLAEQIAKAQPQPQAKG